MLLKKNNIVLLEIADKAVVQIEACEFSSQFFRGACIGSSGNQECDNHCRRVPGWYTGSCKNQNCVCACS